MIILQDHREKVGKHRLVESYLKQQGYTLHRVRLNVGDYMFPNGKVSIDVKQNIEEMAIDLHRDKLALNKKYKKCFHDEIQLVVLVEEYIKDIDTLKNWQSSYSKINGRYTLELMRTIKLSYGVRFEFVDKRNAPKRLLEILKGENYDTNK